MGNYQFKYKQLINEEEPMQDWTKSVPIKDEMKQKVKFILFFMFSKLKLFFIIGWKC